MDQQNQRKDITKGKDSIVYTVHLDEFLGQGQFGKVYKAHQAGQSEFTCKIMGTLQDQHAVKVVEKDTIRKLIGLLMSAEQAIERLRQEVVTWRKGSHPNIVKFYDFIETEKNYYFVSEYCEGPTLEELISKKAKIDEATALIWLKGLASAVSYLHSQKIIHRDIKPANIIFKQGVPKLVDFGLAKQFQSEQQQHTVGAGTIKYMAPELLQNRGDYTCKVDIWALGSTFFELIYDNVRSDVTKILIKLQKDLLNVLEDHPQLKIPPIPKLNPQTIKILIGMLQFEEDDRFDHLELMQNL